MKKFTRNLSLITAVALMSATIVACAPTEEADDGEGATTPPAVTTPVEPETTDSEAPVEPDVTEGDATEETPTEETTEGADATEETPTEETPTEETTEPAVTEDDGIETADMNDGTADMLPEDSIPVADLPESAHVDEVETTEN